MRPGGSPLCLWLAALAVYAFLYLPLAGIAVRAGRPRRGTA